MKPEAYSYQREKEHYAKNWPQQAKPYLHLERYLRCWLRPEEVFQDRWILDMGAGECTYTRLISDRFEPAKVIACELFFQRMLPAFRENQSPRLQFVAGDCFHLPFRDRCFGVVFGSFILHQIPDLEPVAREIQRVLRDDGSYVGIEPNPLHPLHLYRYLRGRHSPNQYLLRPRDLDVFRRNGFGVRVKHFYARVPFARGRLFGTCMGIVARRNP